MEPTPTIRVRVHKAQSYRDSSVPNLVIEVLEELPSDFASLEDQRNYAEAEATDIVKALQTVLPGCTFDRVFIAMAKIKACDLRVTL